MYGRHAPKPNACIAYCCTFDVVHPTFIGVAFAHLELDAVARKVPKAYVFSQDELPVSSEEVRILLQLALDARCSPTRRRRVRVELVHGPQNSNSSVQNASMGRTASWCTLDAVQRDMRCTSCPKMCSMHSAVTH